MCHEVAVHQGHMAELVCWHVSVRHNRTKYPSKCRVQRLWTGMNQAGARRTPGHGLHGRKRSQNGCNGEHRLHLLGSVTARQPPRFAVVHRCCRMGALWRDAGCGHHWEQPLGATNNQHKTKPTEPRQMCARHIEAATTALVMRVKYWLCKHVQGVRVPRAMCTADCLCLPKQCVQRKRASDAELRPSPRKNTRSYRVI